MDGLFDVSLSPVHKVGGDKVIFQYMRLPFLPLSLEDLRVFYPRRPTKHLVTDHQDDILGED